MFLYTVYHFIPFYMKWKRPRVAPPASRWGTKLPQTTLTLTLWPWPTTLDLYLGDLDVDPCDLDLGPSFLKLGWKLFFTFLTFLTLTFDLWPWPSNLSEIWWSLMPAPNFRCVGPTVQPAERKQTRTQTDRHTGGKNGAPLGLVITFGSHILQLCSFI